nr:hypothetical protein [Tanacetum cinerariifolium]
MSYLSEYEEIDGGYVAFGGDPKEEAWAYKFQHYEQTVKENLVRGLPSNFFEKNHTCVACQKGKQHKAFGRPKLSKDSPGDGFKPSGKEEKKDAKDLRNEDNEVLSIEEPIVNQEKNANVNNTNNINTVSLTSNAASIKDNAIDEDIVYGCADDPNMPNLKGIVYSDEDEDVGAEVDMTNLDTNIPVSLIITTRIHKNHPVEQIVRDIHSATQTRRMTKNVTNYGIFSTVQQRINHKDF